ncbi:MAG: rseP [Nevskia sp.]|nr:rseP [Nevskia sp.]
MFEMLNNGVHNTIWFIVAISVLVAFHEFGHFWVARRLGVKVLRFSVGFGRPIWKHTAKDGVEYVLAMIPLGGYVKMLDEREGAVAAADLPRAFNRQPVWSRIAIFAAGPLFNFVLAIAFYWAVFVVGIPDFKPILAAPVAGSVGAAAGLHEGDRVLSLNGAEVQTWSVLRTDLISAVLSRQPATLTVVDKAGTERELQLDVGKVRVDPQFLFDDLGLDRYLPPLPPKFGELIAGNAADLGGLKSGDVVLAIDGEKITSFQQLQKIVASHAGESLHFELQRGSETLQRTVLVGSLHTGGITRGYLGAASARMVNEDKMWQDLGAELRLGPVAAVPAALQQTWGMTRMVAQLFYRMLVGDISVKNLSGPISTAQAAGSAAKAGLSVFLGFVAFVSLNLGIVNLIPIPVLDGGQIVSCLIEAIKGKPLSERAQVLVQQLGLALLVLIMGFAIFNDIARQFG